MQKRFEMDNVYFNIEKALLDAVRNISPNTPMSVPNNELTEYPQDLWLSLHNLRGESIPVTLGFKGEDEHPGLIQLDFNVPYGTGSGVILNKVQDYIKFFTAGKVIKYNGQHVRIRSTSLSPGRQVGGWFRVSLSIYYFSRSIRN